MFVARGVAHLPRTQPGTSNGVALQWTGRRCSVHPMHTNTTLLSIQESPFIPPVTQSSERLSWGFIASVLQLSNPLTGLTPEDTGDVVGHSDVCGGTTTRCRRDTAVGGCWHRRGGIGCPWEATDARGGRTWTRGCDTDAGRELGAVLDSQDTGKGRVWPQPP
jgi:hypothetical protein